MGFFSVGSKSSLMGSDRVRVVTGSYASDAGGEFSAGEILRLAFKPNELEELSMPTRPLPEYNVSLFLRVLTELLGAS